MQIAITGAGGFLGKNLGVRLREATGHAVIELHRNSSATEVRAALARADFIFHLAGANRPQNPREFLEVNAGFTRELTEILMSAGQRTPIAYASSVQAANDNPYGKSKRAGEEELRRYGELARAPVYLFRLTNVFGKWCRPYYNSVVATFCHQVANGLPVTINDPRDSVRLIHVDDVVAAFAALLTEKRPSGHVDAGPTYEITVGQLADTLREFAASRTSLRMPGVGAGFLRALYSTYVSYLPPTAFAYQVPKRTDRRGEFVEMLKTPDCGQFSYLSAPPGVTRGEHYHHTKTEKFLVLRGTARFDFRNLLTNESHRITVRGGEGQIVETIPGWAHAITNVGEDELLVMLWANEVFDRSRPDTIAHAASA
jgi:UDP-2-acetamido-2,6-beta-L-arabino-hexul-4-ose reductase